MLCSDREAVRLEQVLQHPQFVADPFAAITAHLEATMPPKPPPPRAPPGKSGPGSKQRKRQGGRREQMQVD